MTLNHPTHPKMSIRRALRVWRMSLGPVAGVLIEQAMH